MDLSEKRKRWSRMLVQAAKFAELENTHDACDRAKACLSEVERELARARDDATREALESVRERAKRCCDRYGTQHDAWLEGVRERERRYRSDERDVYGKPLPVEGIE